VPFRWLALGRPVHLPGSPDVLSLLRGGAWGARQFRRGLAFDSVGKRAPVPDFRSNRPASDGLWREPCRELCRQATGAKSAIAEVRDKVCDEGSPRDRRHARPPPPGGGRILRAASAARGGRRASAVPFRTQNPTVPPFAPIAGARRKVIDETYNVCDSVRHEYEVNTPNG
jgi:hypothetical protein